MMHKPISRCTTIGHGLKGDKIGYYKQHETKCGRCGVQRLNSGDDRLMDYWVSYRVEFE